MKKIAITGILSVFTLININGQVGINTTQPHASAALEIAGDNKGFLLPRIALTATTDNTTIASPATGLLVYNTATAGTFPYNVIPGQYYHNGSQWIRLSDAGSGWNLTGNSGTTAGVNFMGTTDNTDVIFKRRNVHAGLLSDHQTYNTSFGVNSYKGSANGIQGIRNTAIGSNSLHGSSLGVVTGSDNTAVGANSLLVNDAEQNVAVGSDALRNNTSGDNNTAIGFAALTKNTTGRYNVANGSSALKENTEGVYNVAIGGWALSSNKKGNENTAIGNSALMSSVTGAYNTALGSKALNYNNSGNFNVAIGYEALFKNFSGSENIAIGYKAGTLTGDLNNTVAIGNMAVVSESNSIQLGNADITKITGQVPFTTTSDRRFKENIQTIPLGLDFVNGLHPVEYIRKNNKSKTKEWGVIAQELQETLQKAGYQDAGIVQEDGSENKMLSVRYTDLLAPMIKAIQELTEHNKMLNNRINQLEMKLEKEIKK